MIFVKKLSDSPSYQPMGTHDQSDTQDGKTFQLESMILWLWTVHKMYMVHLNEPYRKTFWISESESLCWQDILIKWFYASDMQQIICLVY